MNDNQRKKIFIVLAVVALILLGTILWLRFMKQGPTSSISGIGTLIGQGKTGLSGVNNIGRGELENFNSSTSSQAGIPLSSRQRFVQLSAAPIAGATFVTTNGRATVRYISKENGFIYDVDTATVQRKQLTNTTFAKGVAEAFWAEGGETVVIRYVDHDPINQHEIIKTYLGTIGDETEGAGSPRKIIGSFLQDNISAVTVSPDGMRIFYLVPTENGVNGILYDLNTQKGSSIFQNAFSEWAVQFSTNTEIIFTTKPSVDVPGFSYHYNIKTGALKRFLREKNGLTVNIAPDGKFALFSEKLLGNHYTNIWSAKGYTADEGLVLDEMSLPFLSLSDKCAWPQGGSALYCAGFVPPRSGELPDDWYQGAVTLHDTFWESNRETGDATLIGDPQLDLNSSFDSMNLVLAPDETALIFTNKKDGSLWLLNFIPYTVPNKNNITIDTGKDE
jgi:hypothetical protein